MTATEELGSKPSTGRRDWAPLAAGTLVVAIAMAVGLLPIADNSTFTHLATGRLILATGHVPTRDPYTFTALGHPWTDESWLPEILYRLVWVAFGTHGLQLLHSLMDGLLAYLAWVIARPARNTLARLVITIWPVTISVIIWSSRPLLVGLICLALVILYAERERWSPWWLLPIMWLWVNSHGSWFVGPVYLLARIVGRALDKRPLGHMPRYLGFCAVGAALGAINPIGIRLLEFPLHAVTARANLQYIQEWKSPDFASPIMALLLAFLLLTFLLLTRRPSFEDALLVVGVTGAGCLAARNMTLAVLVTLPVAARCIPALVPELSDRFLRSRLTIGATFLLGLAILFSSAARNLALPGLAFSGYASSEVTYLQDHGYLNGRVVEPLIVGNYMELRYGPIYKTFIDDRYDMFPHSLTVAYNDLSQGYPDWLSILNRYQISAVLWYRKSPLAYELAHSHSFKVVLSNTTWIIAVRRS
jgi:hypothetical protein